MVDYRFLLRLFLRRLHVLLLVALPVAVAGVWFAFSLPPSFQARAVLLVETPQVPEDLAASTLREAPFVLLGNIRDRVMTRDNLLDLARDFRLHADRPGMSPDDIVADMRRRTAINLPQQRGNTREGGTFSVAFEATDATVAAAVANTLVEQILSENAALRSAVATQTLVFFDEELSRLEDELTRETARILAFQQANQEALPDSLAFRRSRQTAQQERLLQVQRELSSLAERRERMVAMFERTGRVDGQAARSPEERELQELRRELSRALRVFSPENPRLRSLQAEVDVLEAVVADMLGDTEGQDAEVSLFDMQLSDLDAQMDFLASQRDMIEEELEQLAASIEATAANAAQLSALERNLQNLQSQYNTAVARRAQARVGERIEAQARGVRILVIEPATAPDAPNRPNRRAIAIAGVGGGLGLGFLAVALLIMSNRAVLRPVEITTGLGMTPFGSIPLYRTRRQILMRRAVLGGVALLLLGAVSGGLWWLDQYYMPLDLVLARIGAMIGLDGLRAVLPGMVG
ncbi:MAG: GumC family protein [Alkalilacustris sp.]